MVIAIILTAAMFVPASISFAANDIYNPSENYYASYDGWISSGGKVIMNTKFKDGSFWGNNKVTSTPANGQENAIYKIELRTSLTVDNGKSVTAFCANVGSWNFNENQGLYIPATLDPQVKSNILSAFNYINDKYGSLDGWQEGNDYTRPITASGSTRVIAQTIVWRFVGMAEVEDIKIVTAGYDPVINNAIADVMANYSTYTGTSVTDLVYLAGPAYPSDIGAIQPQIIPIFASYNVRKLGWMRSTEISGESFKKAIVYGSDAWNFAETFANTPIKYFEHEEVRAVANQKASEGTEVVRPFTEQLVGMRHIWDLGDYFSLYKNQNGNVFYDWASWEHFGVNGELYHSNGQYSIRRFSAYIDVNTTTLSSAKSIFLAPEDELGNMSYLFPINDNVFVFVNGTLAYWGGTDVIAGNNQYGALTRTTFNGMEGIKVRNGVNGVFKDIYPHTDGWCIDLEENADAVNIKSLLTPGFNRIDIICDEYWEGGGMNRLQMYFN